MALKVPASIVRHPFFIPIVGVVLSLAALWTFGRPRPEIDRARQHFGGSLKGTITLTAGLGGMGGAQPLAVTMNDGVAICIDCDPRAISRRIEHRYLDVQVRAAAAAITLPPPRISAGGQCALGATS